MPVHACQFMHAGSSSSMHAHITHQQQQQQQKHACRLIHAGPCYCMLNALARAVARTRFARKSIRPPPARPPAGRASLDCLRWLYSTGVLPSWPCLIRLIADDIDDTGMRS
jgi:hypothetical protein